MLRHTLLQILGTLLLNADIEEREEELNADVEEREEEEEEKRVVSLQPASAQELRNYVRDTSGLDINDR